MEINNQFSGLTRPTASQMDAMKKALDKNCESISEGLKRAIYGRKQGDDKPGDFPIVIPDNVVETSNKEISPPAHRTNSGLDLFDAPADQVVMPSGINVTDGKYTEEQLRKNLEEQEALKSHGLERAVKGETVKSMMVPEDPEIVLPNYVLDLSTYEEFTEESLMGLDALIHPDGTVTLYINTYMGLMNVGKGLADTMDRILLPAITHIFSGKARLFRDFEIGKPLKELKHKDITNRRLTSI